MLLCKTRDEDEEEDEDEDEDEAPNLLKVKVSKEPTHGSSAHSKVTVTPMIKISLGRERATWRTRAIMSLAC